MKQSLFLNRNTRSKSIIKGFTLLEVLVVLVLVGLLSTLLMQGFFYVLQLRTRILVHLSDLQQGTLQEYWFRSTTVATVADYQDGKNIFQGNEHEFSGLTLAPLAASRGTLASYAWQVQTKEEMTILRYRKPEGEYWEVARWSGTVGNFRYMDARGKWYDKWPPPFFSTLPAQLPTIILFFGQRRQTPITWVVQLTERNQTKRDERSEGW